MPNNRDKFNYIQAKINSLDPNKKHILFWSYYLDGHNLYHSPLLIGSTLLAKINKKQGLKFEGKIYPVHHVCHISRFIKDGDDQIPKIFEASKTMMMQQNDLRDKAEEMHCKLWIITLGDVDKPLAREFETEYLGVRYTTNTAAINGLKAAKLEFIVKLFNIKPTAGFFCAWLTAEFLHRQGDFPKSDFSKILPADIYNNLISQGYQAQLLYDSKLFK